MNIDLKTLSAKQGFKIFGATGDVNPNNGDQAGFAISSAGDINADGIADIIIGAPNADPFGRIDAGIVYVIYGKKEGFNDVDLAEINGTGFRIIGIPYGSVGSLGYSVNFAGDINADDVEDIVIGAPKAGIGTIFGIVYVIYGNRTRFNKDIDLAQFDATQGFRIFGANIGAGWAVGRAGDVNYDGISDIIIGMPDAYGTGVGYVIYGSNSSLVDIDLAKLTNIQGFRIIAEGTVSGIGSMEKTGFSVSAAGDINADGIDDIAIGAPGSHDFSVGGAYIVYGKVGGYPSNVYLNNIQGFRILGVYGSSIEGDRMGWAVSSIGDINADGITDVAIGAISHSISVYGLIKTGAVYIVHGKKNGYNNINSLFFDDTYGFKVFGTVGYVPQIGAAVSGTGDVNSDGIDDFIIGAPQAFSPDKMTGAAYIIYGKKDEYAFNTDLAQLNRYGIRITGEYHGGRLGQAVSGGGDINGDSVPDIVIGAPYASPLNRQGAGIVYVIYGQSNSADSVVTDTATPTASTTSTLTRTLTPSPTLSFCRTPTDTSTLTKTATPTLTVTITPTPSQSNSKTLTSTITPTISKTFTPTFTDTHTHTSTITGTNTKSLTPTLTKTPTNSLTLTEVSTTTATPLKTLTQEQIASPILPPFIAPLPVEGHAADDSYIKSKIIPIAAGIGAAAGMCAALLVTVSAFCIYKHLKKKPHSDGVELLVQDDHSRSLAFGSELQVMPQHIKGLYAGEDLISENYTKVSNAQKILENLLQHTYYETEDLDVVNLYRSLPIDDEHAYSILTQASKIIANNNNVILFASKVPSSYQNGMVVVKISSTALDNYKDTGAILMHEFTHMIFETIYSGVSEERLAQVYYNAMSTMLKYAYELLGFSGGSSDASELMQSLRSETHLNLFYLNSNTYNTVKHELDKEVITSLEKICLLNAGIESVFQTLEQREYTLLKQCLPKVIETQNLSYEEIYFLERVADHVNGIQRRVYFEGADGAEELVARCVEMRTAGVSEQILGLCDAVWQMFESTA